jgi:NAD(P)-dependent dehydrogenase (short-subunit alcohol dehydrogenase family)
VAEGRYISQAERARRLIDKGVAAWQRFQAFAMANDELVDSVVLRGQKLWLPHHETDRRQFRVTLVISLHFPVAAAQAARAAVTGFMEALSQELSDEEGTLVVRAEAE